MLRNYIEVFAWSYEDMPGLDIDIVVHRLPTREGFLPMKQKVRRMRPEMLHEGAFGTHSSGHTMAKKILRTGYYWSTMEADCHRYARSCHKCQIYADKVHVPPVPLNVLTAP